MISDSRRAASALRGEIVGRDEILCPGPGHDLRDRSLSVRISASSPDGFLTHSFAGDDWRECRDHVRRLLGIERDRQTAPRLATEIRRRAPPALKDNSGTAPALALWRASVDPRRTLAERYLSGRGLDLGDDIAGAVLRWNAAIGAMVALFHDIRTDEPRAVSRTFLDSEGRKLGRKFLGPVGGGAIKLDSDEGVLGGLHIGEGVETSMSARQLGLRPAWALGSKGAIRSFPIVNGIEALTILAEPDAAAEVEACAARWHAAGREVLINRAIGGKDLNDTLGGKPCQRA